MPRGASPKREREYETLKGKFHKSGRYEGREEEVAARIVNKQRAAAGETKAARKAGRSGQARSSPERRGGQGQAGTRKAERSGTGRRRAPVAAAARTAREPSRERKPGGRASGRTERSAKRTADHEEIRRWVESHGGCPAMVRRTSNGGIGILRVDFPGYSGRTSLETISWEDFFKKFDESNLEFIYQDLPDSRFNKLVRRREAPGDRGGGGRTGGKRAGGGRSTRAAGGRTAERKTTRGRAAAKTTGGGRTSSRRSSSKGGARTQGRRSRATSSRGSRSRS